MCKQSNCCQIRRERSTHQLTRPGHLNPQEEAAYTPEDQSEPAPPPVEPADRPITPDEMVIPQIHEEEAAREAPPVLVDPPPYWQHHPW